jgi:uncharacterized tellurite resistance protein B-like protein
LKKPTPDDDCVNSQVSKEMEDTKSFAKTLNLEEVKSGEWFIKLLLHVVGAYERNVRSTYFRQKYPGLPPDEIADILTSITAQYAAIAGAIAGVAASANEIAAMGSAGLTLSLLLGSLGAEMLYLCRIQMRLVLDLSVLYDLQLDTEDPEDILLIFGYALGVAPAEALGKELQAVGRAGTAGAIKKVISKGTLESLQKFGKGLGLKILRRTIIEFAIPVASAAVGSGYNYIATKSVGKIAKIHFKNRGKVTEELRAVISKQNVYDLAIPAAVMFMAQVDGNVSPKEKELYRAMLSRMSFEEHSPADFNRLITEEQSILDAVSQIEGAELRKALIELLTLMAVYDGLLANEEREFLTSAAERLGVSLDIEQVERQATEYHVIIERNLLERTAGAMGGAAVAAVGIAGHTASRLKKALGKAVNRQDSGRSSTSPAAVQDDPV